MPYIISIPVLLKSDGEVWDDLRVPAQNTKLSPAKSEPAFESFIGGTFVWKFDNANADDESLHFSAQMPHGYKEGSDIYPHVHWCGDTTGAGNVVWTLEYTVAIIDSTFPDATSDVMTSTAPAVLHQHQLDYFTTISDTTLTISHIFNCALTRNGTDTGDTYAGNACFLEFDFHYLSDTIGSKTIDDK